jgi:NTP pyrophosphatase (non-canonical NTP hydrolase)
MNFDEYQTEARKTAVYPRLGSNYVYPAFGLAGEAGEIMEKLKKLQRDHGDVLTDEYRLKIASEIGDLEWYIANLCEELGLRLDDVIQMNIKKLADRKIRNVLKGDGDNR